MPFTKPRVTIVRDEGVVAFMMPPRPIGPAVIAVWAITPLLALLAAQLGATAIREWDMRNETGMIVVTAVIVVALSLSLTEMGRRTILRRRTPHGIIVTGCRTIWLITPESGSVREAPPLAQLGTIAVGPDRRRFIAKGEPGIGSLELQFANGIGTRYALLGAKREELAPIVEELKLLRDEALARTAAHRSDGGDAAA